MKTAMYPAIQAILKDRVALAGLVALLLASLAAAIILASRIQPSELQVSVQYTSFGGENIYRSQWFYTTAFAAFGVMVALLHSAIFVKIYSLKGRDIALLFGAASVAVLVIAVPLLYRILGVASLT